MIARVGPASRERYLRMMGQLSSVQMEGRISTASCGYLYRGNFDPAGVPPLPFPALDAHGSQAQKGYGAVSFSQLDAVANLH